MALSIRMTKQVSSIVSPYSDYSLNTTKWIPETNVKPRIESIAYTLNGRTNSTHSRRFGEDGIILDVFQNDGHIFKILKNKYGEIINYKSNFEIPLNDLNRVYNNMCDLMCVRLSSLYSMPSDIKIHK